MNSVIHGREVQYVGVPEVGRREPFCVGQIQENAFDLGTRWSTGKAVGESTSKKTARVKTTVTMRVGRVTGAMGTKTTRYDNIWLVSEDRDVPFTAFLSGDKIAEAVHRLGLNESYFKGKVVDVSGKLEKFESTKTGRTSYQMWVDEITDFRIRS